MVKKAKKELAVEEPTRKSTRAKKEVERISCKAFHIQPFTNTHFQSLFHNSLFFFKMVGFLFPLLWFIVYCHMQFFI